MNLKGDVDIDYLVQMTEGGSGADIKNICTEAGMFAIRAERDHVVNEDFVDAIKKITGEKETTARITTGFI